jgi:hypothetical protein
MPLFVGCLALLFPRVALVLTFLLGGDYLSRAYPHYVWPLLGFVFLPLTTLTFAFAVNSLPSASGVSAFGWLLTGIALLADVGIIGNGRSRLRERERDRESRH